MRIEPCFDFRKATGRLAVCAGSCGPGNLHLINGLFDCHRNRVPVLAIASHIPVDEVVVRSPSVQVIRRPGGGRSRRPASAMRRPSCVTGSARSSSRPRFVFEDVCTTGTSMA